MGDMADDFRALKEHNKKRRQSNLNEATSAHWPWDWVKHTDYHWSITLQGDRLDYWPSGNRFRWRGKTYFGGVRGFIAKRIS
jgi:hypothetical protein